MRTFALLLLLAATIGLRSFSQRASAQDPQESRERLIDYRSDPKLEKPITLRLLNCSLSDCMKALSDATGAGFAVASNIEDRKVTVVCKERPASEAMTMIASTLFGEWSSEVGGYRFGMTLHDQNEEIDLLQAEQDAVKDRLKQVLQDMISQTATPKEDLEAEREVDRRELDRLRLLRDPEDRKKYDELARDYYHKFAFLDWYEAGFALKNAPDAAGALASGQTLFATTLGQGLTLPYSAVPTYKIRVDTQTRRGQRAEWRDATGAVLGLRLNPVYGRLESKLFGTGLGRGVPSGIRRDAGLLDSGEAENKLYKLPLREHLRKWSQIVDKKVLGVSLASEVLEKDAPGYSAHAYTMAEQLAHLSDASGVPIVADAFRLPASGQAYIGGKTVGDAVQNLRNQVLPEVRGGFFRTESGWLMYKHPHYWRLLGSEIPEKLFAPLEAKAKAKTAITVDDYADFAASLTPWQATVFPERPDLTRFPRLPLIHAMPALRLWASLTADQKMEAYRSGLAATNMAGNQLGLFRTAALDLFWQGSIEESFLPILVNGAASGPVALFYRDDTNGAEPGVNLGQEQLLMPGEQPQQSDIDYGALRQSAISFVFGDSPRSGASFDFELGAGGS